MRLVLSKIMDDASKLVEQYVAESQTGDMNDVAKDMNKSVCFLLCLVPGVTLRQRCKPDISTRATEIDEDKTNQSLVLR